ncbi:MAG: metallophosphoesterase [Eubacterium sp.]
MKILLIADVHDKPDANSKTLTRLKRAIDNIPNDLIVFLGDIVHGPDITENYEKYLRRVLDITGDKPFASVFGNHDDECYFTKNEILSIMKTYKNCLTKGRNYVLKMNGETLLFIDSGSYYDGEESNYDTVKKEQILWAKNEIEGEKAILFQHIIMPDIMDLIENSKVWKRKAVLDSRGFCRFKKNVLYSGKLGERPCPPDINTGELEALCPNLKAAVFGHDHKNTFELDLKGVRFIQCAGCGSNSYDKYCRSSVKVLDTKTLETQLIYI